MKYWYVYIIEKEQQLYVGITTDLQNRMYQHGNPALLYSEKLKYKEQAANREKQMKGWSRYKKREFIK
jgi:predicted GIY-YIG superfamily endonuclease